MKYNKPELGTDLYKEQEIKYQIEFLFITMFVQNGYGPH